MTLPEVVMWAVVLGVGFPSALRNPTSAALVIAWFAGQAYYLVTNNNLPVHFYLYPDIFVVAVIMAKHEECNLAPYRGTLHQLKCLLLERSPADRIVLLIFPLMWLLYCADMSAFHKWWSLFGLVIAQFIAAGAEAFNSYRRDADAAASPPDHPGSLLVAHVGGRFG